MFYYAFTTVDIEFTLDNLNEMSDLNQGNELTLMRSAKELNRHDLCPLIGAFDSLEISRETYDFLNTEQPK